MQEPVHPIYNIVDSKVQAALQFFADVPSAADTNPAAAAVDPVQQ